MSRLVATTIDSATVIATAASALAFPPQPSAFVPAGWSQTHGVVPEFDLEIWSTGSLNFTDGELFGAKLRALVVVDDTFTAVHGTEIFTAVAHGLLTGDGPLQLTNAGGALPAGLSLLTDYWVIKIDADTYYLAASLELALAGTHVFITGNGTGTHTHSDTASTKRVYWHSHGLLTTPIALANNRSFSVRCSHRPEVVAYGLVGTLSAGTVSAAIVPVSES